MGSLRVLLDSESHAVRPVRKQASEVQFTDADGAVVICSLNVDEDGVPVELDVWKTTFEPLLKIPKEFVDVSYQKLPKPH